jgi:hypothetical protein
MHGKVTHLDGQGYVMNHQFQFGSEKLCTIIHIKPK